MKSLLRRPVFTKCEVSPLCQNITYISRKGMGDRVSRPVYKPYPVQQQRKKWVSKYLVENHVLWFQMLVNRSTFISIFNSLIISLFLKCHILSTYYYVIKFELCWNNRLVSCQRSGSGPMVKHPWPLVSWHLVVNCASPYKGVTDGSLNLWKRF